MGLKRCGLWLLPLTCFSLAFPARVHAQEGRLLKLPFETVPKNILVTRGTLIEFNGLVNRAGDQQYYLQSNGQVCASGSFRDQWALDFDTSKMRSGYATVTLHAGAPGGANVLLARLHIAIAEKVPFTLNCLTDSLQPVDVVQLHLTAENHAAQKVELTLDNKPLVATLDAKGTVSFEPGDEQLGRHKIGGRVTAEDELVYELEPVSVDIVGKVRLLPLPVGNTLDLAAINGSIPLRCQTAPSVQVATVIYKLDAGVISEQHDGPFQSILWNPRRARDRPAHTPGGSRGQRRQA